MQWYDVCDIFGVLYGSIDFQQRPRRANVNPFLCVRMFQGSIFLGWLRHVRVLAPPPHQSSPATRSAMGFSLAVCRCVHRLGC